MTMEPRAHRIVVVATRQFILVTAVLTLVVLIQLRLRNVLIVLGPGLMALGGLIAAIGAAVEVRGRKSVIPGILLSVLLVLGSWVDGILYNRALSLQVDASKQRGCDLLADARDDGDPWVRLHRSHSAMGWGDEVFDVSSDRRDGLSLGFDTDFGGYCRLVERDIGDECMEAWKCHDGW